MTKALSRVLLVIFGGAVLLSEPGIAGAGAEDKPTAIVECSVDGHVVCKPREECFGGNATPREANSASSADDSPWAALEAESGITLIPVLACRSRGAMAGISSAREENRGELTRVAVQRGKCTRLRQHTWFARSNAPGDVVQIRTVEHGRLWVSPSMRVPDLASMTLVGRLESEGDEQFRPAALTTEEQQAIDAELVKAKTVPGFVSPVGVATEHHDSRDGDDGHSRECRCANGLRMVGVGRSCDEACDTLSSTGSNEIDDRGRCHHNGELMDCRESGRRKGEDLWRR